MIPIFKPYLYQEAKDLAFKAIEDGDIAIGPNIELFENEFSRFCNRNYGVTCSNGTIALYIAVKALKLPKDSEIILPSMTILSCLTAITENNHTPVFCDIDSRTYNLDFESLESKITPKTSAIIVINTYGLVIDTNKLKQFKTKYPNIKIIEDASESHGAHHNNIKAGSLGDISTFSFYTNKLVTTGEGGMVLTDDEETYKNLLMLRNLNFLDRKKYIHTDIGFNFRLTNIQCAIGLGQLQNIDETIQQRKRVAYEYNKYLKDNPYIQIPYEDKNLSNVYWYYNILIKKNYNKVLEALTKNDIDYRHFFYPLHKQPFINSSEVLQNSETSFDTGILLPIFNELSNNEIKFISQTILNNI
jgi:perosamine synthetase